MDRQLTIPSNPAAISEVEAFLSAVAAEAGLSEDHAGDLIIAGTEAVNNAILHGNASRPELTVRIQARLEAGEGPRVLQLIVDDHGGDFRPARLEGVDPTDPEHLLDESGRGLLIIRHLMDEVRIETGRPGTRVVMSKRLS
jgi:serine/threonine-protein kinase RsbW